jgi:hypothetical protein
MGDIEIDLEKEPDYASTNVDNDKSPKDYTYVERRAEIYRMIQDAGHPRNLERNQEELGKRYGVSQRQISDDIERLRAYEKERSGSRAVTSTRWLGSKIVNELLQDAQQDTISINDKRRLLRDAFRTQMEYNDFLFSIGELDEEPDKMQIEGDASEAYMEMLKQMSEDDER